MSIILQCFYWNSPVHEGKVGQWWKYIDETLESIENMGIQYLWLPPLSKSCDGQKENAMGYDAYDYYDLGDYDQRGSMKTLWGDRKELRQLIRHAHGKGIQIIAELLFSHCRGGDKEANPYTGTYTRTHYEVKSGRFYRDYEDFTPCKYDKRPNNSPWKDEGAYDYCYTSPHMFEEFLKYAAWLKEEIHVDAFRYDNVKAYPSYIPLAVQNYLECMSIGEYWDDGTKINRWLRDLEYKAMVYDFPLRGMLTDMCNQRDWDVSALWGQGVVFEHPHHAVTFIENHDTEREHPVLRDKILAYAFILTMEGLPTIFWKDYFIEGMAMTGSYHGLERLIQVHHQYAGGAAAYLGGDRDVLSFRRNGDPDKAGLVILINTHEDEWKGKWVETRWKDTTLVPVAWGGKDLSRPIDKRTYSDGTTDIFASPRGFAVYVPQWAAKHE